MMNSAIRYRKNFSSGNTSVRCFKNRNGITTDVDVYLHGNHIASVDTATNALTIKDGIVVDNPNYKFTGYRRVVESFFKVCAK